MVASGAVWDVIIVGAGTAGCVVAERLSRNPNTRVLLLEAGPDGSTSPDLFTALATPGRLWPGLTAQRTPGTPPRAYPRGRGIGGSGAVNGLLALAPSAADRQRWRTVGLVLDADAGADAGANAGPNAGPNGDMASTTTVPPSQWGPADRFLAVTGHAHGFPLVTRAGVEYYGIGPAPLHMAAGARASTDSTHLAGARRRPNLTVLPDTSVLRLLLETEGRCVGVQTGAGDELTATHTVLCTGAVHSPALLLASGLTRPGIGAGLADHVAVGATLHLRRPAEIDTPATCALGHSADGMQILPLNRLGLTPELRGLGALLVGVLHNRGRGTVTIDAAARPVVTFDLLGHAEDRAAIVGATRLLLALCQRPEARAETHFISADDQGTAIESLAGRSDADLLVWAEANLADYVHATGTCAYGRPDDPLAVVGPGGRVHATTGLAVIDASVFPSPPEVNPWLATVGLASALADDLATAKS